MGFDYLNGLNWKDVTRDERYFCAELYFEIKQDTLAFVKWLKEYNVTPISDEEMKAEWEIGFEVCFYRDYIFKHGDDTGEKSIRNSKYSQKRTFDLCLFSQNRIIIIEAKAQQGFETNQNEEFRKDISDMLTLLKKDTTNFNVSVIALASSIYFSNLEKKHSLPDVFAGKFSWKDIYNSYCRRTVFGYADKTYKN
jgi:hypothetical protein